MGVGSEVYGALINDRKAIGIELKPSYYEQTKWNAKTAECEHIDEYGQGNLELPSREAREVSR
jgi:hypothetical protein